MQRTLVSFFLALLISLAFLQSAMAVIYRWVDDNGVVHFAQQPPPGVKAAPVDIKQHIVSSAPAAPSSTEPVGSNTPAAPEAGEQEEISYAESRRRERAENKRARTEAAQKRDAECQIMRRQKAQGESGPRILVKDENGETRRLLDTEREDMLKEANAFLSANCN